MKTLQINIGPMLGNRRAVWLAGDVDGLKIGDKLTTENGERIVIDAIGMPNTAIRNALPALVTGCLHDDVKEVYLDD